MELQHSHASTNHTNVTKLTPAEPDIVELLPWSVSLYDGDWFGRILVSATLLFGIFGNFMTITVLRRLQTGWSAMNLYLTSLAVSDNMVLLTGVLGFWCRKVFHWDLFSSHWLVCKLVVWIFNSAASVSVWILVALTVQRAVSVVWPHRVTIMCTRNTTITIVALIAVVMYALYSHILYGLDLVYIGNNTAPTCTFSSLPFQEYWGTYWVMVDMMVFSVLPSALLLISNVVLAWTLASSVRDAQTKLSSGNSEAFNSRKKKASSTTKTVIAVSVAFGLLTLPLMVYNTFFHLFASENPEVREFHYFIYECFFFITMVNFSINFYLYFLTGSKFKNEFQKLVISCFVSMSSAQYEGSACGRGGVSPSSSGQDALHDTDDDM